MLITDALLGEHGVFYLLLQDIEQALPAIENLAILQNRIAPLTFSLEAHANLEDELLFTALEPHLGTQEKRNFRDPKIIHQLVGEILDGDNRLPKKRR